jgi:hypothetical protein
MTTPLVNFIFHRQYDICVHLIKKDIVQIVGNELIHFIDRCRTCVEDGKVLFNVLLESGIDVNAECIIYGHPTTALMKAFDVSNDTKKVMMYYIESTILSRACVYGMTHYTKYLLKNYTDLINIKSKSNVALYVAYRNGYNKLINILLRHNAPDFVDEYNNDIMMKCISSWRIYYEKETKFNLISKRNIYMLYKLGIASIHNRNTKTGRNVIDMCIEFGYINILKTILNILMY